MSPFREPRNISSPSSETFTSEDMVVTSLVTLSLSGLLSISSKESDFTGSEPYSNFIPFPFAEASTGPNSSTPLLNLIMPELCIPSIGTSTKIPDKVSVANFTFMVYFPAGIAEILNRPSGPVIAWYFFP